MNERAASVLKLQRFSKILHKTSKSGSRVHYPCTYVPKPNTGVRKRFLIINT